MNNAKAIAASPEAAPAAMLTDTEMARIHRRVTGASRFDASAIMLMREVEHAMNEKRAATPAAPCAAPENLARSLAIHLNANGFTGVTWEGLASITAAALAQPAPVQVSSGTDESVGHIRKDAKQSHHALRSQALGAIHRCAG